MSEITKWKRWRPVDRVIAGIALGAGVVGLFLGVCRTWGRSQDSIPETCWSLERGDRR